MLVFDDKIRIFSAFPKASIFYFLNIKIMSSYYSHLKIFQGLKDEVIEEIIAASSTKKFLAGETIISQGEQPNGEWYIILSGSVEVSTPQGSRHIMRTWDIFGEMALLSEEVRSASVVATQELEVIVLSSEVLLHLMEQDESSLSKEIMQRMEENLWSE